MRKSRVVSVAAAVAVVPLLLASCSGGGGDSSGGGDADTLTLLDYYNNEPDKTIMQGIIDGCGDDIGVTIERETLPGADLIQSVLQRSSSQTLPDVLMLDNPDIQEIASTGGLAPLSNFDISTEGFAEGIIDAATYEGEVYGLAPAVNTIALFYNKDMLDEAGVTPPTTWDELREAAATLTEGDRYGLAFTATPDYEGSWQFLPFMWSNGGDETDLQTPEVAEALQFLVDIVNDGSASESVITWTQGDAKDQFTAGKAAMVVNGPWNIPSIQADADFEWDSVPIPVPNAGDTAIAPLGGEAWTIPETGNADKQAKAAEFVECMTSPENEMAVAEQRYLVPTRTDLVDEYVEKVPDMEAFAELIVNARSRTGQLGDKWPEVATVIYTAEQSALTGQATPEEAFAQAEQG